VATTRDDRTALFGNLQSPDTQPQFWAPVAGDVDWTVDGTHTLAGRYHSKHDFIKATFDRLDGVLQGGAQLDVEHPYLDATPRSPGCCPPRSPTRARRSPTGTAGSAASTTT
jgi:hypothetical protein